MCSVICKAPFMGPTDAAGCWVRILCLPAHFSPLMSATSHSKLGDLVTGIAFAPYSKNHKSDALVGLPHVAEHGNSMYLHNPGQWIYDGEVDLNSLTLREIPVLADDHFRAPPPPTRLIAQISDVRKSLPRKSMYMTSNRGIARPVWTLCCGRAQLGFGESSRGTAADG